MNYVGYMLGNFLLSAWLWQVTFDWFHPIITGIVMFLMLRLVFRAKRSTALLVSMSAQLFALCLFGLIVQGFVVNTLQWTYQPLEPDQASRLLDELYASFSVMVLYIALQSLYFALGKLRYHYRLMPYLVLVVISNGIGFSFSYVFIRMAMLWHYVG